MLGIPWWDVGLTDKWHRRAQRRSYWLSCERRVRLQMWKFGWGLTLLYPEPALLLVKLNIRVRWLTEELWRLSFPLNLPNLPFVLLRSVKYRSVCPLDVCLLYIF